MYFQRHIFSAKLSIPLMLVWSTFWISPVLFCATPAHAEMSVRHGGNLLYLEKQAHKSLYPPAGGFYPNGGILAQITDRLTWQNTQTLAIEPWLATSWQINADSTIYTFELRSDITFSDGTPVDAASVALNFDTYGKGSKTLHLPPSEVINNYDHSEVVGPLTVRFYFSKPSPGFLQGTSVIGSGIVSPRTLHMPLEQWGEGRNIIGSGPFVVQDEVPGKSTTLQARHDYNWGPGELAPQGPAKLEQIRILVVPEDSIRIGAFLSGQADFIREVEAYDENQITRSGNLLYAPSTRGVNDSIVFRPDNDKVADVRVRLALLRATDRQEILHTLFSPRYPLARSILAGNTQGFQDHSSELYYSPTEAKDLLDKAGWLLASDGWRYKNGKILSLGIHVSAPHPQSRSMLVLLAQQWRKIGVKLNILTGSPAMVVLDDLDPQTTPLYQAEVGRADPDVLKSAYYPTNRNVLLQKGGQSQHVQHFTDPECNQLLLVVASETDPLRRLRHVADIQSLILKNSYSIPIFEEPQVYAGSTHVHDMHFEAVGRPVFYRAWLDNP